MSERIDRIDLSSPRRGGRLIAVSAAAFAVFLGHGPANADFAAGVAAYEAEDFAGAFEEWLPEAEAGNDAAQRNIGLLYQTGRGVDPDPARVLAVFWYQRAAAAGNARAQANLGNLYLAGIGVPQDNAVAANWFVVNLAAIPEPDVPDLLVAEARALDAPDLGLLEREAAEDIDLPPDLPEAPGQEPPEANVAGAVQVANVAGAAQVAEPAAVDEPAEKLLAIVVPETLAGIEVADNPGIAGLMAYRRGDYLTALANLLHGAVQGDPSAQFLGGMYRDGAGIPPDPPQAYLWWTLASGQGHLEATQFLTKLRAEMTDDDLSRAVELLEMWVERR